MGHLLNMALKMSASPSTRLMVEIRDDEGGGYVEVYRNSVLIDTFVPPTLGISFGREYALSNGDTFYIVVYGDYYHGFDYFENGTYITSSFNYGPFSPVTSATYTATTGGMYNFACLNVL